MVRMSPEELAYQLAIRGWDQRTLAPEARVSQATVSRAMVANTVRGVTALKVAEALRRVQPDAELVRLVPKPQGWAEAA